MTTETRKAPAIVGKAKEEKKPYFFRNTKSPGGAINCFTGNAPKNGEWFKDTITQHNLVDGQVVHLTEAEYDHLRNRGIEKPIITEDSEGRRHPTGQTYIDRRFELNAV